jgi:hypothetical protein
MIEKLDPYQGKMADLATIFITPKIEASRRGKDYQVEGYDYFNTIFKGFSDICETIETIEMLLVMIEVKPPRSRRISIDLYFKHIVASYLSEVYILKERLNSYATKISRLYNKTISSTGVKKDFDQIYSQIKESLGNINKARNHHVHLQRHSDHDLNWLSSLKLVSERDEYFREGLNSQIKILQHKWKQRVSDNNEALGKLLTRYFDVIFEVITIDDKIVLPVTSCDK